MRVIYLDIDSLRPDHMGCYGYHRATTPNLDRVAAEGVRFTGAYVNSSPCVPSRASLLSGRFGVHHGALTHWGPGGEFRFPGVRGFSPSEPLLTRYLRGHGYETVSFSSFADRHLANWFYAGWSEFHTHTLKGGNEDADEVNAALLPWLKANGQREDYFLHVQYWDPHRNYTVGPEHVALFENDPPPAWPDEAAIESHQANYGPFTASELHPFGDGGPPTPIMPPQIANRDDLKRFVDGYDASIRFMDDHIGALLDTLADLGVLDETAIIVSADHGEAMGEGGVYGDHVCAGEAVHRVPMIVRWPDVTKGGEYGGLLYNVDLHPTLCELLGLPVPEGWDGVPFTPAVRGEAWEGRSHLVWDHALYSCQRAVRTREHLFIRTYHPGLFPFDDVQLYDMRADPWQTRNLALETPELGASFDQLLNDWTREQLGPGAAPDPLPLVVETGPYKYVQLEPWLERLRAKGREDDAAAILLRQGRFSRRAG